MAEQEVSYVLSLKDLFTGKIKEADGAVNKMEGSLHEAGKAAGEFGKEMLGAIGVTFALYKGFEFVKEAKEQWEQLEFATSQVEAGLESTRGVAGLTFEELKKSAHDAAHDMKFTQAQIMSMQSILLTFPSVTKQTFGPASQAIYDMSTRLKVDLNSSAIQVGKALQDPIKGVAALHRVGVNFSQAQTDMIKKLVETGHATKAQAIILNELNTEFAGSAKAAAQADVSFRYEKTWEELSMTIGQVADQLAGVFMPILEKVAGGFKDIVDWAIRNKEVFEYLGIAVGIAAGAYVVYRGVLIAGTVVQAVQTGWTYAQIAAMYILGESYEGASIATKLLAAAQYALNAAWEANPIGIIIVAITAVVTAVIYCYNHFAKFRAFLWATWAVIKEVGSIIVDYFVGLKDVLVGTFTLDSDQVARGMDKLASSTIGAGKRIAEAAKKGWNEGMADFAKDQAKDKEAPHAIGKPGKAGAAGADAKPHISNPKGTKVTTINIKIENLVRQFDVKTTTISEGAGRIRELITQAVLSAVNDSQIITGQ